MRAIIITLLCIAVFAVKKEEFLDKPILAETNSEAELAQTGTYVGEYMIIAVNSGRVLDISGGSTRNGAGLIQEHSHGGNNQRFEVWKVGKSNVMNRDYFVIRAKHSGKVLTASGRDLTQIIQSDYQPNNDYQIWTWEPEGVLYVWVKNKGSDRCMAVKGDSLNDGAPVIQDYKRDKYWQDNYQLWYFLEVVYNKSLDNFPF